MSRTLSLLFMLLFPILVFAAGGGEHGGEAHLTDHDKHKIMFQAINVGIILAGILYFGTKPIKKVFLQRRADYLKAAEKSLELKKRAEEEKKNIQAQLTKLESTADESISRARAEAADLKANLINEAKQLSERLRKEAESTAIVEVAKAKALLRTQTIEEAATLAEKQVASAVSNEDHLRLNKEFIKNIETVQP